MRRRLPQGSARVLAVTVAVVAVAIVLLVGVGGVGRSGGRAASPSPALDARSPFDRALLGIGDDGSWSKDTALAVFAAAFGPLPGVEAPGADRSWHSGTLALRMVEAYWPQLSDAQKAAVRDYVGPAAARTILAAYHPDSALVLDGYQQTLEADAADIGAAFGRPLGIPIRVVLAEEDDPGGAWAWARGNWDEVPAGSHATACIVTVPPATTNDQSRAPYLRWVFMHEVWHCFQYTMVDHDTMLKSPPWVTEGGASWVAEAVTGGAGAPPPEANHWAGYVTDPGKPLYARVYDAVGFYPQLYVNGINPWSVLQGMVAAGGSDAAFQASGASASSFADRWGSSWFRDAQPSDAWAMSDGYGIPPPTIHASPQPLEIADGLDETISAKPNAGAIADVHTTAFITRVDVSGVGRVADPADAGFDRVVRAGTLDLCTSPDADCACPPDSLNDRTPPDRAPERMHAAVTGEQRNASVMNLRGISKDEWCGTRSTPAGSPSTGGNPCPQGCGGSNGDPHLRTIDGRRYDLQAAGEYVLLRSTDGAVEIQGRQERLQGSGSVTINSAAAARVNRHRVGFYASANVPVVQLDGVPVTVSATNPPDLGPGATLTAYQRGFELDLPDGTKLWALSVGRWGINLLVLPSDALRASGVGLIARVPAGAGLRVPAPPDGSTFPLPRDRHERYHDLYEVLAPGWRVTASTSLFDYPSGVTTDSFTVPGFPPETAPQTIEDLDPTALSSARTACAGVVDPDLAEECAFDVAVTGAHEYVLLYGMTEDLQTEGIATLDRPATGGTPPPSLGGAAFGVELVDEPLSGVGGHVLGPDGTLYVVVGEQAQAFGDVKPTVLAVDGATGKVKRRAPAAAGGALAWAAGSLWAGEFNRGVVRCQVTRLDPLTLAVQANVPTVCGGQGGTMLASVGDAIWFVDPTGADADGHGAHLRRIDPATNAVDPGPEGNLELPFITPFLGAVGTGSVFESTSDGLIYGDRRGGLFRLSAGSGAFDPLPVPATSRGLFPAGNGVWTQTEIGTSADPQGTVSFFSGDPTAELDVPIQGDLVGADDSAVFADYKANDPDDDELWRYPIDGSVPRQVAVSGSVPTGFGGQLGLLYRDPQFPLLVGDGLAVKLWLVTSSLDDAQGALMMQSVPLP